MCPRLGREYSWGHLPPMWNPGLCRYEGRRLQWQGHRHHFHILRIGRNIPSHHHLRVRYRRLLRGMLHHRNFPRYFGRFLHQFTSGSIRGNCSQPDLQHLTERHDLIIDLRLVQLRPQHYGHRRHRHWCSRCCRSYRWIGLLLLGQKETRRQLWCHARYPRMIYAHNYIQIIVFILTFWVRFSYLAK